MRLSRSIAPDTDDAWGLTTGSGGQYHPNKGGEFSAWVVRPGDVAAAVVPEPSAFALALAGLAAVLVIRKRRH